MKNLIKYINEDENNKYNLDETKLNLELYVKENGNSLTFGIYLDDNNGGSGITIEENTPDKAAEEIAAYIADYFYKGDE